MGEGTEGQEHERNSWVDGNAPYLDKGLDDTGVSSVRTPQMNGMLKILCISLHASFTLKRKKKRTTNAAL